MKDFVYEVSTNYEQLYNLILENKVLVGFVDYKNGDYLGRDVVKIKQWDICSRGIGHTLWLCSEPPTKEEFCHDCQNLNLGFIPPS